MQVRFDLPVDPVREALHIFRAAEPDRAAGPVAEFVLQDHVPVEPAAADHASVFEHMFPEYGIDAAGGTGRADGIVQGPGGKGFFRDMLFRRIQCVAGFSAGSAFDTAGCIDRRERKTLFR